MARTEGQWQKGISFISPSADLPILLKNSYLNFGGVNAGDLGYGLRDNDGVIEFKNDAGAWTPFGGDTSGLVPYIGAIADVDLGDQNLFTNDLTAKGFMKFGDLIDNVSINRVGPNAFILGGVNTGVNSFNTILDFSSATVDRTVIFPDKDGTLAMLDDLDSTPTFETVSKNLKAFPNELIYTGENLTSIEYTTDLGTVVKTFSYTGENLTSVVLSGSTPSGIDLTKTLSYTGDNLTGVVYS